MIHAGNLGSSSYWFHWIRTICLSSRWTWVVRRVPLPGDIRTVFAQAGFFIGRLSADGLPFDSLFLSDWMECSFDLVSIKVKLSGNCIIVTCPFMIPSLNGFDDSRIALDYSRLNFPCWLRKDEVPIMYNFCSLIVLGIIELVVSWNICLVTEVNEWLP